MLPEGVRFFRVCRRCTGARVDGVPTAVDGWGVDAADPVGVFDAASLVVCRGAVRGRIDGVGKIGLRQ